MELKISEIRRLCNLMDCKVDLFNFLSDSEVQQYQRAANGNLSCRLMLDDGVEVTQSLVDAQDRFYDDLDLYIKFLLELAKFRPLPF